MPKTKHNRKTQCRKQNKAHKSKISFYVVAVGRTIGLFLTWDQTQSSVSQFPGAVFKKFQSLTPAIEFLFSKNDDLHTLMYDGQFHWPQITDTHFELFAQQHDELFRVLERICNPKLFKYNIRDTLYTLSNTMIAIQTLDHISENNNSGDDDGDGGDDNNNKQHHTLSKQNAIERKQDFTVYRDYPSSSFDNDDNGRKNQKHGNRVVSNTLSIYTDGSCLSNGCKTARSGWACYWNIDTSPHVLYGSLPIGPDTNNRGELYAILATLFAIQIRHDALGTTLHKSCMLCKTRATFQHHTDNSKNRIGFALKRALGCFCNETWFPNTSSSSPPQHFTIYSDSKLSMHIIQRLYKSMNEYGETETFSSNSMPLLDIDTFLPHDPWWRKTLNRDILIYFKLFFDWFHHPRDATTTLVDMKYLPAHTGIYGNEVADRYAKQGATLLTIKDTEIVEK